MANDGLVAALILGGGALAAWAILGRQEGAAQSAGTYAGGGEGDGFGDPTSLSYYDPATGLPLGDTGPFDTGGGAGGDGSGGAGGGGGYDPGFTPGYEPAPQTVYQPTFSPDFEQELLRQNEETNRFIVREQEKQTRAANIEAAVVAGGTVALAARPIIRAVARTPALLRQAAPAISRVAGPVVRVAGPVGAGVGLGLGGVAALEKTGALDQVQRFSDNTLAKTPQPVQSTIKTVALPLSTVGAVATGLVGRGSVAQNVRSAYRGTYLQKGVSSLKGLFGRR